MRWRPLGRRSLTGAVIAALMTTGLIPLAVTSSARAATAPVGTERAKAAADVNLALGRPATAGGSNGPYTAGNVTDGTQASYWEGPGGSFPQWVQVDLGATRTVDEVVLKLPATWESRNQTLSLQASTDGSTFRTLAASAGRAFNPAQANTVPLGLTSPAEARYVRVHITANTGWNAAQLSELEVYGDDSGTTPPPTGTNLARNKPVEATSSVHNFVAANATDDSTSTYWEAAGHPSDLTVKLGANADIDAVVVKLNPDQVWAARTQSIQVLGREHSASGFTSLRDRADYAFSPSRDNNSVTIPVTGRWSDLRLRFFSNTGAPGGQVAEFQVVGTAAPAPDLTVTGLDWTPAAPSERDAVTVNATVRNAGTARSAATTAEVGLEERSPAAEPYPRSTRARPPRWPSPPAPVPRATTASPPWSTRATRSPNSTTATTAAPPRTGWSSARHPARTSKYAASPPTRPTRPSARPSPSPSPCTTAAPPRRRPAP